MPIITLCGSTQFKKEFRKLAARKTLEGHTVLTVHLFRNDPDCLPLTEKQKWELDQLHFRNIRMSDEILIIAPGGYIGLGACDEIFLAFSEKIRVTIITEEF